MAMCETSHWTLDCGDGHGCYLVEYSDTGELAGWGCNSEPVKGRPKRKDDNLNRLDTVRPIQFCCNGMSRDGLARALDDLVADLAVPSGKERELVTQCSTGTVAEILHGIGLVRKAKTAK
ncbi:hypothetical protein ACFWXH_13080 [Mesorhizobium sp. NPDC059054]|uniref:hypothetical protein n=1 Tax=unclassified Mesorhizobium TaxID=325217 RepID=UPI000B182FEB|nr:hypothetical protein [Mesorhizobium sp. 1M-11]